MDKSELARRVQRARCRVFGCEEAANSGHRAVVASVMDAFDNTDSAILVEPSLSGKTDRPPDVVLVDPEIGVHVFEVKACRIEQIETIEPGGVLCVNYKSRSAPQRKNAINQVKTAMFDIRDATANAFGGTLTIPFKYSVVFPSIHRSEWIARFGCDGFCPPEFLFAEDIKRASLLRTLGATDRLQDTTSAIRTCSLSELQCVWTAFGDNSVLYLREQQRPPRLIPGGTLGEQFDRRAASFKRLSDEQQRLSEVIWDGGPRLVRGVAGSGKTIVLAVNLARRIKRVWFDQTGDLFDDPRRKPRNLAVCFNRALAPFIRAKVEQAFEQRTGTPLPKDVVQIHSMNKLMYVLSRAGAWRYLPVKDQDPSALAAKYREQLALLKVDHPDRFEQIAFDSIYVDEGQDFAETEYELLRDLCRTSGGEPNLYVFYDDAQNLYGRARPNWASLGLNVRGGRSVVMTECFRNPRSIVEMSFNVLYATVLPTGKTVPTRDFGDLGTLQEKGLIEMQDGRWRVKFARREGRTPLLTLAADAAREINLVLARLTILVRDEKVRPQDILLLTLSNQRANALANAITRARIERIQGVHVTMKDKDAALFRPEFVTVSTVHSAKGYDAFVVLLCSANEFPVDEKGRACFHVACTRAIEHLEMFAYRRSGLVPEVASLLEYADPR